MERLYAELIMCIIIQTLRPAHQRAQFHWRTVASQNVTLQA